MFSLEDITWLIDCIGLVISAAAWGGLIGFLATLIF